MFDSFSHCYPKMTMRIDILSHNKVLIGKIVLAVVTHLNQCSQSLGCLGLGRRGLGDVFV